MAGLCNTPVQLHKPHTTYILAKIYVFPLILRDHPCGPRGVETSLRTLRTLQTFTTSVRQTMGAHRTHWCIRTIYLTLFNLLILWIKTSKKYSNGPNESSKYPQISGQIWLAMIVCRLILYVVCSSLLPSGGYNWGSSSILLTKLQSTQDWLVSGR